MHVQEECMTFADWMYTNSQMGYHQMVYQLLRTIPSKLSIWVWLASIILLLLWELCLVLSALSSTSHREIKSMLYQS